MSSSPTVNVALSVTLNVALRVACTEAEGPGRRYALWVQGCPLRCAGCCNPELFDDGVRDVVEADAIVDEIEAARVAHDIEGIALLGGEPTLQARGLAVVARGAQARGLSVLLYSGYTLEELRARGDDDTEALLAACDVLIDGRYDATRRSTTRRFIGSDNQRVHFLTTRHHADEPCWHVDNSVELRVRLSPDGALYVLNGWPVRGAATR